MQNELTLKIKVRLQDVYFFGAKTIFNDIILFEIRISDIDNQIKSSLIVKSKARFLLNDSIMAFKYVLSLD